MDLLKAIRKNDFQKAEKILKKGYYARINDSIADTQEQTPIRTIPLCLATARGQLQMVKMLLHYGADIRVCNNDWASPIHLAAYRGYGDIINLFLTDSNDRRSIINNQDQLGDTPLHIAVRYLKSDIVNLLLDHDCQLSILNKLNKTALDTAREIYAEESDAICARIVSKMRENATSALPRKPSSNDLLPSILADAEYMPPPPPPQARLGEKVNNNEKKELNEQIKIKDDKIINIEDDITMHEAEKSKIKADIAKLTEKLNRESLAISRKEAEKVNLEKEIILIKKKFRPPIKMVATPTNVEEKSYECPVCLEVPLPPKNVYQCTNGHIYCCDCKDMPNMHICPQCRVPLDKRNPIRNIAFSEIIGSLFPCTELE